MFEQQARFHSAIDGQSLWRFGVLTAVAFALAAWLALAALWVVAVILVLAVLVVEVVVALKVTYEIDKNALIVRALCARWNIPLASIRKLKAIRSKRLAPALSRDRIAVQYCDRVLEVSPRRRALFVAAIQSVQSEIAIDGLSGADSLAMSEQEADRREASLAIKVIATALLVVVAATALMLWLGTRPPSVTFARDRVIIGGVLARAEVSRYDVLSVSLEKSLPSVTGKTAGFEALGSLRGYFTLAGRGTCQLYIDRGHPPYVLIQTARGCVFVNFRNSTETENLFASVSNYVQSNTQSGRRIQPIR